MQMVKGFRKFVYPSANHAIGYAYIGQVDQVNATDAAIALCGYFVRLNHEDL